MFGGIPEILFHLKHTRSNDSASGLYRIIFDYAAAKVGKNPLQLKFNFESYSIFKHEYKKDVTMRQQQFCF